MITRRRQGRAALRPTLTQSSQAVAGFCEDSICGALSRPGCRMLVLTLLRLSFQVAVTCNAGYHLAIAKHPFDPASSGPSQLFLVPSRRRPPPMARGAETPARGGTEAPARSRLGPQSGGVPVGPAGAPTGTRPGALAYLTPHRRISPPMYRPAPGSPAGGAAAGSSREGGPGGPAEAPAAGKGQQPEEGEEEESSPPIDEAPAPPEEVAPANATRRGRHARRDRGDGTGGGGYGAYRARGNATAGTSNEDEEARMRIWAGGASIGNSTVCLEDLQFHPPLVCIPDLCAARPPPEHGFVLPPGPVLVGRRVSLGCDPGYVLWGGDHALEGVGRPTDPDPPGPADGWTRDLWLARPLCLPQRVFTPGAVCVPTCGVHGPVEHATVRLPLVATGQLNSHDTH